MSLLLSIRYCPAWQGSPTSLWPFIRINALKLIFDGFAHYFNTYGRLTRQCESRSAAAVYATVQENIIIFTLSITRFQRDILSYQIDSSTCAIFSCFRSWLATCHLNLWERSWPFASALVYLRTVDFCRTHLYKSRLSVKVLSLRIVVLFVPAAPPFVLYRPQLNSVFIFVSVEKDGHSLVHLWFHWLLQAANCSPLLFCGFV